MNTKSKITLVAAVLTSLAAPAFAAAVVPEFPGELAQPTQAQSDDSSAAQSYASSRTPWAPSNRSWTQSRSSDQRLQDRGSAVIN